LGVEIKKIGIGRAHNTHGIERKWEVGWNIRRENSTRKNSFRWEVKIKIRLKINKMECVLDSAGSEQDAVAGSGKHGNQSSDSIEAG
jgi:hypothetical protein